MQDKKEHCILFNVAVPVSVVGTYGGFRYFEGTFVIPAAAAGGQSQALISWWETATEDTGLTPTAGGATLQYEGNASA